MKVDGQDLCLPFSPTALCWGPGCPTWHVWWGGLMGMSCQVGISPSNTTMRPQQRSSS